MLSDDAFLLASATGKRWSGRSLTGDYLWTRLEQEHRWPLHAYRHDAGDGVVQAGELWTFFRSDRWHSAFVVGASLLFILPTLSMG